MSKPPCLPTTDVNFSGCRLKVRYLHADRLSPGDIPALIAAHHTALHSGQGLLKRGNRNVVSRVIYSNRWVCVKEYRNRGVMDSLKNRLRGSRANSARKGAHYLQGHGIAAPDTLALIEDKEKSYLVMQFIDGAVSLKHLMKKYHAGSQGRIELHEKRIMISNLGSWLRRVHSLGIYHNDWSLKNILAVPSPDAWTFYFVDTESVVPYKRLTYRRQVKNLGQLNDAPFGITHTDRVRFLKAYAETDMSLMQGGFPRDIHVFTQRRREKAGKK